MALDLLLPRGGRSIDAAIDSNERLDVMKPWSWPVMKTLEQVLTSACSPLAATLFEVFHATEAVFSYTSADAGGPWAKVSHSGTATTKAALAAYAAQLCVDAGDAVAHDLTALSVHVAPKCGAISTAITPDTDAGDAGIVVESFYRVFVLRHLSFMQGTAPPAGQGIVLTYGRDHMRIEHVHASEPMACGPVAECLWIDEVPKSQRITLG